MDWLDEMLAEEGVVAPDKSSGGFGFEQPGEGKTNEWLTPPKLVAALGHFDLDPCACPGMPWKLADINYCLPENNGLIDPWVGRVFCNPPYGPHVGSWAKRMAKHRNGIFLIFSRTETAAWSDIWKEADAVLFPFGRCCFYRPDGTRAKSGTAPSALLAYGQNNVDSLRASKIAGALVLKAEWIEGVKISSL